MTLNMTIIYLTPAFYVFLTTFTAFILLLLTSLSVPLVSSFYFLYSSQANGIRFGLWGWCLDSDGTCSSPLQLGYTWDSEIDTQITGALAFYPFSAAFAFLTAMSLLPVLCFPDRKFGDTAFRILAWASMALSALAFLFMVGIASVAKYRFERNGYTATFGNLHGISLAATLLLLAAAVSPYLTPPPKERPSRSHSRSRSRRRQRDLEAQPSTKRREISRRPLEEKA